MRSALALLALVLALPAVAQDKKGEDPRLPFNPFAKAAVGDWLVFQKRIKTGGEASTETIACEVTKVEGDKVTVVTRGLEPPPQVPGAPEVKQEPTEQTFSNDAAKPPTITDYLEGTEVTALTSKDEKRKVGDKELDCKALTFKVDTGEEKLDVTIWISSEIPAGGLVGMKISAGEGSLEGDLLGYGAKDKTTWGKTAKEVQASLGK